MGILGNEDISAMEAAEKFDDSFNLLFNGFLAELLESLFELTIHIKCNILWCSLEFIHEILESNVSGLLESHIVIESICNNLVHLSLQLE